MSCVLCICFAAGLVHDAGIDAENDVGLDVAVHPARRRTCLTCVASHLSTQVKLYLHTST